MRATRILWYTGTVLTALAMLAVSARGQRPARADANLPSFRAMGIAARLSTTPEALAAAYERARRTNPRLNRGQFIAAHVLADDLGAARPNVTTQALLAGLERGRSLGQTLRTLGLTAAEAKAATRTADRQRKEAERRAKAGRRAAELQARRGNDR